MSKTLVLFSAGHDSFYCLMKAVQDKGKENVKCLIFDYGQTNPYEIESAVEAVTEFEVDHVVVKLPKVKSGSELPDVSPNYYSSRNLVFLSIGTSVAENEGCATVYIGVCKEDSSLFPDCRQDFISKFQATRDAAYGKVSVLTPCLIVSKLESYNELMNSELASLYKKYTYSCYNNSLEPFMDRKGCGYCGACLSIKKGIFNG